MARSIAQIQAALIAAKTADGTLSGLTSTSQVAIWLLWTYIVAVCQWTLETLYDAHVSEVQGIISTQKPHTLQWYITMAKAFQYGDTLPPDTDVYDPVRPAGDAHYVVTFAAAVEFTNLIRIKVATGTVGSLAQLGIGQLTALTTYMGRVKDAGVRLNITSGQADDLQTAVKVYYDALVLDATGVRLDGTSATPVMDALNAYLDSLPFNGVFSLNDMIAALRAVDGVKDVDITVCQANYGALPYVNIIAATPQQYTPDAGYMALNVGYFNGNVAYTAL